MSYPERFGNSGELNVEENVFKVSILDFEIRKGRQKSIVVNCSQNRPYEIWSVLQDLNFSLFSS